MSEALTYNSEHIYYQLRFSLQTSMLIGNGLSSHTDNDVLRNVFGMPFIPGTTIAGMLREMAGNDADQLFGKALKEDQGNISSLYVYDAETTLKKVEDVRWSKRDNVALDQYKTALDQKKFDYEVIEPDIDFIGLIEINKNVPVETKNKADALLRRLAARGCSFGAKKSRGMGRMNVTLKQILFDLSKEDENKRWLDFDPFDKEGWKEIKLLEGVAPTDCDVMTLKIGLRLKGGISIRVYTTDLEDMDYRTLRYQKDEKAVLVPGTTWAGAFRARVREFIPEKELTALFGAVIEKTKDQKQPDENAAKANGQKAKKEPTAWRSQISFSETRIERGSFKKITRNAIDRFSGKTKDTALYGEETYYGGEGTLTITLPRGEEYALARQAIGAAIADLHHGFLSVGGLTAVGRGLFEIRKGELKLNEESIDISQKDWENMLIQKLGSSSEVKNDDGKT